VTLVSIESGERMNRLVVALLCVLIVLVATHGFLVWRVAERAQEDAERAQEDAERQSCIQRAEATAVIALLAPPGEVDAKGRLRAMTTLGAHVDDC
jgi:uncharacterized iron-regulated membrane protein